MIRSLTNDKVWPYKHNWIDQNGVVVGYDDRQQCCECFGWGVFNAATKVLEAPEPDDLPYHFGKADDNVGRDELLTSEVDVCEDPDIVHVELLPDDGKSPKLVLEFVNCHNGYYYHDFKISTIQDIEKENRENSKDKKEVSVKWVLQ